MELRRLSKISIIGCIAGLVLMIVLSLYIADSFRRHHQTVAALDDLQFAVASLGIDVNRLIQLEGEPPPFESVRGNIATVRQALGAINHPDSAAALNAVDEIEATVVEIEARYADFGIDAPDRIENVQAWPAFEDLPVELLALFAKLREIEAELTLTESQILQDKHRQLDNRIMAIIILFGFIALVFGMVCILAFILIHRRIHAPVQSLIHASQLAEKGDFDQRVDVHSRDELGELASCFNRMLAGRKAHEQEVSTYQESLSRTLAERTTVLNTLPAHIALLDPDGTIRDVNDRWRHFGQDNDYTDPQYGVGQNYLRICENASGVCAEEAEEAVNGIRSVLAGESESFALEYPCHSPDQKRWFRVMATPVVMDASDESGRTGAVVMHVDVTQRKQAETDLREQTYLLDVAARMARFGGWSIDLKSNVVIWSDEVARIHELPPGTSPGIEEALNYYAPEWRDRIRSTFNACAKEGIPYDEELEIITARGNRVWVRTVGEALRDEYGNITHVRGAFQEIRERKQIEQALEEKSLALAERIKELRCINVITEMLERSDNDMPRVLQEVVEAIPGGWRHSHECCARIEFDGREYRTANFERTRWLMDETIVVHGKSAGLVEVCYRNENPTADEGPFLREERNLLRLIAGKLGDVAERQQASDNLRRMLFTDELTGLYSRIGFNHQLKQALAELESDSNSVRWLVLIDLHRLNDINQAFGFDFGNKLLVHCAGRLSSFVTLRDCAARVGGDQFAVLLTQDRASTDEARTIAAQIDTLFADPFVIEGHAVQMYVTMGLVRLDGEKDAIDATEAFRRVQLAFHTAREQETTHWMEYADTIDAAARRRIQTIQDLKLALPSDQFELHYQPKVRLQDGQVVSAEALLRWRHPERGLLSPDQFIPAAEHSKMIIAIGEWTIRRACERLRAWQAEKLSAARVAVNVSMVQIVDSDLAATVARIVNETGIEPGSLSLEITESVLERDPKIVQHQMKRLHDMGIRLSLDDFGTGYSSLGHLNAYPFHEIKIDQSFVYYCPIQAYSREIVRMIIRVARVLGCEVVAEGVESPEHRDALLELGCDIGQGYYYSMPLEEEDLYWLLKHRAPLPLRDAEANHS